MAADSAARAKPRAGLLAQARPLTAPAAALLDSNIVVAMLSKAHEHHQAAVALLTESDPAR